MLFCKFIDQSSKLPSLEILRVIPFLEIIKLFKNGDCLFFLQRFYNEELAKNFMLQICVEDIEEAHELCLKSEHKEKISPISDERWGRVFYLWGPSGELLHVTQLAQ